MKVICLRDYKGCLIKDMIYDVIASHNSPDDPGYLIRYPNSSTIGSSVGWFSKSFFISVEQNRENKIKKII